MAQLTQCEPASRPLSKSAIKNSASNSINYGSIHTSLVPATRILNKVELPYRGAVRNGGWGWSADGRKVKPQRNAFAASI
jgi:hypothetical protein